MIYSFTDDLANENIYLIPVNTEVIIIDPHKCSEALWLIVGKAKIHIFLTHEHYDHISGVNWLRTVGNCCVYASQKCSEVISQTNNGTNLFPILFLKNKLKYEKAKRLSVPYVCHADVVLKDKETTNILGKEIKAISTPGHTPGGMSFLFSNKYLFSGDNILESGKELESLSADKQEYKETINKYDNLSPDTIVMPGHGRSKPLNTCLSDIRNRYKWI